MTIREQAFAGLPLSIPVIDAHTHIGPTYMHGWHQNPDYTGLDAFVALQDKLGVNCSVTTPHPLLDGMTALTNEIAAKAAERYPGKIYCYLFVAPFDGLDLCRETLKKYAGLPAFVGVKFLGGYNGTYTDPVYQYAADFANEVGCPVLCHTFGNNPPLEQMVDIADKRPGLSLLLAHQGGGREEHTRRAAAFIRQMPNLYMELCGSLYNTLGFDDILTLVGEDKLIYGTDGINLDPRFDFGRLAFAKMPDCAKRKIFAENYLRLTEKSQLGKIAL